MLLYHNYYLRLEERRYYEPLGFLHHNYLYYLVLQRPHCNYHLLDMLLIPLEVHMIHHMALY